MMKSSITIFLIIFFANCYSQNFNDSLNKIFSSHSFMLEEEYSDAVGGYMHTYIFTVTNSNFRVQWKNPELLKNSKDLDVLLPIESLNDLVNIFSNCSQNAINSKNISTEQVIFKFSNEHLKYEIKYRNWQKCYEEFNAWKEFVLLKWQKENVK